MKGQSECRTLKIGASGLTSGEGERSDRQGLAPPRPSSTLLLASPLHERLPAGLRQLVVTVHQAQPNAAPTRLHFAAKLRDLRPAGEVPLRRSAPPRAALLRPGRRPFGLLRCRRRRFGLLRRRRRRFGLLRRRRRRFRLLRCWRRRCGLLRCGGRRSGRLRFLRDSARTRQRENDCDG
jgi:hypothetical protein